MPVAIAGWYVALFGSIMLVTVVDNFCPPDYVVPGGCSAPWRNIVFDGLVMFGAGLSAIFVILSAVLMAPSHRKKVALFAYAAGLVTALYFALTTSAWGAFWSAALTGLLFLVVVLRYIKKKHYH